MNMFSPAEHRFGIQAGDATQATAARGHAVINAAGLQLALLLQAISSLPLSTLNAHPDISSYSSL